ncbi:MAG: hypothetical protein IJP38_01260 [Oscillospiraceae bacterium]|nr:hypothetical protein [Oscillospiraceae bacterium]
MKKLLSLILAVCMVISIAPAALATEATEGDATLSGVTVEYDIKAILAKGGNSTGVAANWNSSNIPASDFSYSKTKGFFQYVRNSANSSGVIDVDTIKWNTDGLFLKKNAWWAFKIYVPADGMYTPKVSYGYAEYHSRYAGSTLHVSLVKADSVSEINTTVIDNNKLKNNDTVTGIIHPGSSFTTATWYDDPYAFDAQTLTKGEYYVIYSCESTGNWAQVNNFILDGTADDSTGTALMRPVVTATPADITVGETTSELSATVYDNNGAKVEDVAFTYESLNPEIATVEGNVVTGAFSGTAEIKATATKDAMTSDGTTEIKVTYPDAAPVSITYDIASKVGTWNDESTLFSSFTYGTTNGTYEYVGNSAGVEYATKSVLNNMPGNGVQLYSKEIWFALKIYVPADGKYIPKLNYGKYKDASGMYVYLIDARDGKNFSSELMTEGNALKKDGERFRLSCDDDSCQTQTYYDAEGNRFVQTYDIVDLKQGEYYLVYKKDQYTYAAYPSNFHLTANDGTALMRPVVTKSVDELDVEANPTATLTTSTTVYTSKGEAKTATIAYSSANDCATVSEDGTVTAKKGGIAKINITATVADENLTSTVAEYFTVTGPETVSFYAMSNNDACPIKVTATDIEGNKVAPNTVANLERGASVTVTAPAVEDYIFVGWVRGAADSGRLVKTDATYSFTALTNTMLTAVYEPTAEKAYYNWDGAFLGTAEPANPTMFGYHFKNWAENTELENLVRYIAQYEQQDGDTKYTVTVDSEIINEQGGSYLYDAEVTLTSDSEVYWYRDEVQVAYGKEYTFNVWDDTTVSTSDSGSTGPMLYLDDEVGSYYMVEYDAAGYDIVEVGILFGNNANITVNSCDEKMNSQRNLSRGQFAADAGKNTVARGYLIYKDSGEYKVIYSD